MTSRAPSFPQAGAAADTQSCEDLAAPELGNPVFEIEAADLSSVALGGSQRRRDGPGDRKRGTRLRLARLRLDAL